MAEKVKFFSLADFATGPNSPSENMESAVNDWYAAHADIRVTDRLLSPVDHFPILAIFYIEKPPKIPAKAAQATKSRAKLRVAK